MAGLARALGASLLLLLLPLAQVTTASAATSQLSQAMQAAATARQVPLPLIEATAYVNTRWEWIGTPQRNGGVGPMSITPDQVDIAVSLSGRTQSQIAGDPAANVDAGAALLAHYHGPGTDLSSWQSAVVATQGPYVTQQIFDAMRTGAKRTTSTGETITLDPQPLPTTLAPGAASGGAASAAAAASPDYPPATWIPADPSNFSTADRAHDYPIDMIIIHDIEGSYGSAIQVFQRPGFAASSHYVIGYQGQIAQMVLEKDIAWHAGNWDYNTRAIGIEHEGFASRNLYTTAEYNASASLAASICSRWGVPMDRAHVIGHNEVPDPNNPGLFGGADHHWDPGPYWDWSYYLARAQANAAALPSPPHMMPDAVAVNARTSVTVSWKPARTCRASAAPITGYTVVGQPGNLTTSLPATATTAMFNGLQPGTAYIFTVTAQNSYGQDSVTTNPSIPGRCNTVGATFSPASPQPSGTTVQITASSSSASCANPLYQFWIQPAGGGPFQMVSDYAPRTTFTWNTGGKLPGIYGIQIRVKDAASPAAYDDRDDSFTYTLQPGRCSAVSVSMSPASPAVVGTSITVTGSATCPSSNPRYQFWLLPPGGTWSVVQSYSTSPTYNWNTNGKAAGTYLFSVWALDATSSLSYDAYDSSHSYALSLPRCSSVGVSYSPASPASVGSPVTVTGAASGCPNPRYQLWFLPPGGSWTLVQGYSASATFSWNTGGWGPGTYLFSVWARDAASSASYDAYNSNQYYTLTVAPCTAVSVSYAPVSPSNVGTTVTVTGAASGCPNPRYQFWFLPPGGAWTLVQGYSAGATFRWNSGGWRPGAYLFSVWARDASSSVGYDTYDSSHYFTLK